MDHSTMDRMEFRSPDGKHLLELLYLGEVRFGPPYFQAKLDGRVLARRVFGSRCIWSPDSRFVTLCSWNTILAGQGPDTSLCVIRVGDERIYDRSRQRCGWIVPIRFEGSNLVFLRDTSVRTGRMEELEIDLDRVREWGPLDRARRLPG